MRPRCVCCGVRNGFRRGAGLQVTPRTRCCRWHGSSAIAATSTVRQPRRPARAGGIDLGDEAGSADCRRALARTLLWSGQLDEALETLAPLTEHQRDSAGRCAAAALAARVHANRREIREAMGAARTALGH